MEKLELYELLLSLPSLKVEAVILEEKKIMIQCITRSSSEKCSNCQNDSSTVNQYYERTLRDMNISKREVYLRVKMRQFYCKNCHRYFSETLDFADPHQSHTHRQTDFMFLVGSKQSYAESALILNTHPKTVERTILKMCEKKADLAARYREVRRLGIDEQSHRKGKKDYLCVLTDLDKGTLVDVLESREKTYLIAHFQSLGAEFCNQITDLSCDCWQAYLSVAATCFPHATLILDRFHVSQLLNACLDNFRKQLRQAESENGHYKKLKWILYKQYHTLSDPQLADLHSAFEQSPALKELYFIREKFHHILDNNTEVKVAVEQMDKWADEIEEKKITAFASFIKTLKSTKTYIANYVENNLSNAVTEGLNNLIRSIRRTAFGMPNFQNLRWRSLAISD